MMIGNDDAILMIMMMSWSVFHQERLINKSDSSPISTSTLLPINNKSINSPVMVPHCMRVIRKLIQQLNLTQISVITRDEQVQYIFNEGSSPIQASTYEACDHTHMPLDMPKMLETC